MNPIQIGNITLYHGDSNLIAPKLNQVDCIITDPPYELGFMGKKWDSSGIAFQQSFWKKMYDLLPPGGYLLAFGGTRTYHRMAVAIEDAGFEIRDSIHWTYGSGFPKNLNLSKAIDKHFGCEPTVVAEGKAVKRMIPGADQHKNGWKKDNGREYVPTETVATHELAKQWEGYGTALKPSHEPIVVARKPLQGTLVENVLKYGVGAIDIDGGRIDLDGDYKSKPNGRPSQTGLSDNYNPELANIPDTKGRWPANTIHDGSEAVIAMFPNTKSGFMASGTNRLMSDNPNKKTYGHMKPDQVANDTYGDEGSAARFFKDCHWDDEDYALDFLPIIYHAKASPSDRGEINNHPTVKPKSLMRYLIKMFCPKKGIVLDPFAGSGTTLVSAALEGFKAIGIELGKDNSNIEIIEHRVKRAYNKEMERQLTLF